MTARPKRSTKNTRSLESVVMSQLLSRGNTECQTKVRRLKQILKLLLSNTIRGLRMYYMPHLVNAASASIS